ncbi:MAG: hypothetical protein U0514_03885 [Candidatus Andersenbacteria bacterium]
MVDTLLGKLAAPSTPTRLANSGSSAGSPPTSPACGSCGPRRQQARHPPHSSLALCTDNAVMVAAVGAVRYGKGQRDNPARLSADPALDLLDA